MNQPAPPIRIRSLHKTFRLGLRRKRALAVCGLDLEVAQGEVFGFLGPNGAGKTTTIKILLGLLRADSGQAELFGQAAGQPAARRRVAFLPELPDLYDYLSPAEFLVHCGRLSGLEHRQLQGKVPALLERVGLDPAERRSLRKFSKGMLQRVGIAQALLADPDLYILDEPMGGLDPLGRRWVKELIQELGAAGKTVFFSSHVLAEAEAVCDRVAMLYRGRVVSQGPLASMLDQHAGTWEILLAGDRALGDPAVTELVAEVAPAGPDSLLRLAADQEPEAVLPRLIEAGYRLRSVTRRHATLEDAFIHLLDDQKETG